MSAIIKRFTIELTNKQAKQIGAEWETNKGPTPGRMMLVMQPLAFGVNREFREFSCAILDVKLAEAMVKTVAKHKEKRP